jgi:stringent starvation protein B
MASEPPKAQLLDRSPWAWVRGLARWFRGTRADDAASIDKRDTIELMIERGPIVIDLDPAWRGVVVPPSVAASPTMSLRFGRALSPPITDLEIDELAISGTLQFAGRGCHVSIPWPAITAVRLDNTTETVRWRDGTRADVVPPSGHHRPRSASPREKRAVVDAMLEHAPVILELDPRRAGVTVPEAHRETSSLALRIGHRLSPPIADLRIDDIEVRGTLQFAGTPFTVVLPWTAIYAARYEDGSASTAWMDDVPVELTAPERGN